MSDLSQALDSFDRAVLERDLLLASSLLDVDAARLQVEPSVSALDRDGWLGALDVEVVHGYEVLERFIHEDGETAAVLQQVRLSATVDGQDRQGTQTISDVWRRRPDGWRLWRRHIAPDAALAEEQRGSEAAAARGAMARDVHGDSASLAAPMATKATVTEIAAVLAAIADAGEDPNALTMEQVEQYVQAFRALKSDF